MQKLIFEIFKRLIIWFFILVWLMDRGMSVSLIEEKL